MAAPTFVPNEAEIISRGKRVLRSSMEYGIRGIDRKEESIDQRREKETIRGIGNNEKELIRPPRG